MIIKFRDKEVAQLKKRLNGDPAEYEFEHMAELETLRKFKETNPELRKALYDNKQLDKKLNATLDKAKHTEEMEELRSYNEGLQKQCRELLEEKEKMERDIKEVEELAEGLLADSARLKAETRSQQTAIQNLEANKEELESMIGQTMN
eukprot:COSAG04_NODE_18438_length_441_cov_1.511696_1_plen_147_part_11